MIKFHKETGITRLNDLFPIVINLETRFVFNKPLCILLAHFISLVICIHHGTQGCQTYDLMTAPTHTSPKAQTRRDTDTHTQMHVQAAREQAMLTAQSQRCTAGTVYTESMSHQHSMAASRHTCDHSFTRVEGQARGLRPQTQSCAYCVFTGNQGMDETSTGPDSRK